MNAKPEFSVFLNETVVSGQNSDDAVQIVKINQKEKKQKHYVSRKRKYCSSSSDESSTSEFFNPYKVNAEKCIFKAEPTQILETVLELATCSADITDVEILDANNNFEISNIENLQHSSRNVVKETSLRDNLIIERDKIIKRLEYKLHVDMSGIDTLTSNLYHYLMDIGLSAGLVNDIMNVLSTDVTKVENTVEHNIHSNNDCKSSWQLEHSLEFQQPNHSTISFTTLNSNHTADLLVNEIPPLQIQADHSRDPRLKNSNNSLQKKEIQNKSSKIPDENIHQRIEENPAITNDWETVVSNVVKTHLRLYLIHNDINNEEYKSILQRAVRKILSSGEQKLETDNISKFLHSYVMVTQQCRIVNNV